MTILFTIHFSVQQCCHRIIHALFPFWGLWLHLQKKLKETGANFYPWSLMCHNALVHIHLLKHSPFQRREKQIYQISEIFLFHSKSCQLVIVLIQKLYIQSHTSAWFHKVILFYLVVWAKHPRTVKTSSWSLLKLPFLICIFVPLQWSRPLSLWISE